MKSVFVAPARRSSEHFYSAAHHQWDQRSESARSAHLHLRAGASVAGFIVDFYCHKAALVIELDGDIHDLQQEEDARRENVLKEMGLRIVRFRNEEVMKTRSGPLWWGRYTSWF